MRAVVAVPGERAIRAEERAPAELEPGGALLRVLDVGLCGTDREIAAFAYGTPPSGRDRLVIGHECLAEVEEVAPGVERLRPGDLVVPMVRRPCDVPSCPACRAGRQDFCSTGRFTECGISGRDGFLVELVGDEERWLRPVPAELRGVGVLAEPLSIAEKALAQILEVQDRLPWIGPRSSAGVGAPVHAVVLGAGPVGLLGAMALGAAGFDVFVYSRDPAGGRKAKLVEAIGARYVSAETASLADLAAQVPSLDVVYEATGASKFSFEALQHLGTNGIFVFTGVPGRRGPVALDTDALMRNLVLRNQVVLGTVNAGAESYDAAIRDLARFRERWPGALESLLTACVPLEAVPDVLGAPSEGIKTVVTVPPAGRASSRT